MNFYDMKLGDSYWNSSIGCQVVRVPGGWLFQTADSSQSSISSMCFVPFNNEFMETSEQGESPATAGNSDYVAVLEQAIFDFSIKENKVCTIDFRSKLSAHLNAALQKRHCA
jgi:hypothetical protein